MPTTKPSRGKRVKGGKGKKGSKQEFKASADQDVKTPRVDSVTWELRLSSTNQDLSACQRAHCDLIRASEYLSHQLDTVERDTTGARSYWEREAADKEREIGTLEEKLKKQAELALEEKNTLVSEKYLIQNEVKKMKEREAQMEQELNDIRVNKENADKDHSENLIKLENKFSEEKICLEREALEQYNQQIALLKQEHCEAFAQLERAFQMEYDVQSSNLKNSIMKKKDLEKLIRSVFSENIILGRQKKMLESTVKNKATEIKVKNQNISELMAKVGSMEKTLEQEDVKLEQMDKKKIHLVSIQDSQLEIEKIQKVLTEQEKEMQHVKQLVSILVKKHREMEKFFHEALDHVRQEITTKSLRYKKEALQDYRRSFREATAGTTKFPPIRTFRESPHSTNSVYSDMKSAAKWSQVPDSEVQLSDLTWEQKEQVLQLIFATMNGEKERKLYKDVSLCTCSKREERVPGTVSRRRRSPEAIFCSTPNI